MTQIARARRGDVTGEMAAVARDEGRTPEFIRDEVARGVTIVPANVNHVARGGFIPIGIGKSLKVKINANIGTSPSSCDPAVELQKLDVALKYGSDTVMDLSTGGDLMAIREAIMNRCRKPLGTVPLYEAVHRAGNDPLELTRDGVLAVIEDQARQGVDYMTIHCGILREMAPLVAGRVTGIVSRGGAIMFRWMKKHGRQNLLYEAFDEMCDIFGKYDVAFSLGDSLRPGCLADASDEAQFAELKVLGELARRARGRGVQVMIEGPGHVPFDQIKMNVELEDDWCDGAPFYVLGPLVTDIAPGYDHITSAIGGTMAAWCGAAMLCYVTPKEHLALPGVEDVRQGVIAMKIAAHAADVAKGIPGVRRRDDELSRSRGALDWNGQFELSIDPEYARSVRGNQPPNTETVCTMCEEFCSIRNFRNGVKSAENGCDGADKRI